MEGDAAGPRSVAGLAARAPIRPVDFVLPAAWVYFALIGGTAPAEVHPLLRLVNGAIGIGLLVAWTRAAPRTADSLDRFVLLGLLLFLCAAVLARSQRAALDAAFAATAYVALLHLSRTALSEGGTRLRIARWLGASGAVLAITYCLLWLLVWSRWLGTGQPATALLNLLLPAGPYGFKHNVALVCGLLIPFLWIVPADLPVRFQRAVGGVALVGILVMAGSRGLWLAALAASVAAIAVRRMSLPPGTRQRLPWRLALGVGLIGVLVVAFLVPGLSHAIADRIGNLLSLRARWDLWAASLREWTSAIVTGVGPGGWPVWLPQTGYFDLTTFSPRHPDSMPFQLLAEAGLLGVGAVAVAVAGVVRAIRQIPATPSVWALGFLLAASVTANPTDLPFGVVLGIAWLAIAVPRASAVASPRRIPSRWLWRTELALIGIVAVVVSLTSWAGILHEQARAAADSQDSGAARQALEMAVRLDPGLGLYHRELGALRLAADDLSGAVAQLQEARELDPADDITLAGLAVAWSIEGQSASAEVAAAEAVALRRSAPINHLIQAWVAIRAADPTTAASALAGSLVAAPWLTGDPTWRDLAGARIGGIIDAAAASSLSDPWGLASGNAGWLLGMSDRPQFVDRALTGTTQGRGSLAAVVAMFACDLHGADAAAAAAAAPEAASPGYWVIRAMLDHANGRSSATALEVLSLLDATSTVTGDVPSSSSAFTPRADDQWVYRRVPIELPPIGPALPSDEFGASRWVADPRATAVNGAPRSRLAGCD